MPPTGAPRSTSYNGRYDETRAELLEIVTATDPKSDANRGRKVALSLLESVDGIAKPADTVNVSFNSATHPGGSLNLTAVLTLTPAPADAT